MNIPRRPQVYAVEIYNSSIAISTIEVLVRLPGLILLERLPHLFNKVFNIALYLLRIYYSLNLIFFSLNRLGVL